MARETLPPESRRALVVVAAFLGLAAIAIASLRRDWAAATVIALVLALLLGVWLWSGGRGDNDHGDDDDSDGRDD